LTKDEIKKVLKKYYYAKYNFYQLNQELTEIEYDIHKIMHPEPVAIIELCSGGKISDPTFKIVQIKQDVYERRKKRCIENINESAKVIDTVEAMFGVLLKHDPRMYRIYHDKYALNKTWDEVCCNMYCEWSQVHRVHAKGLNILANLKEGTK